MTIDSPNEGADLIKHTMTIIDSNETTPLSCFSSLLQNEKLIEALNAVGITIPTPVQAASIPAALEGKDLIVQAQTGSGKTLAFMLPILSRILADKPRRRTQAIIITPTRELATQVKKVIESVTTEIKPACLIGGAKAFPQEQELRNDPRVVVGTPGRIQDFLDQKILRLDECRYFVLDEADEMLSMGFVDEVKAILRKLPAERQGLFYSATMPGGVQSLAFSFLKNPEKIILAVSEDKKPKIDHRYLRTDGGVTSKANALCNLLTSRDVQSAIVFCNTKSDTALLEAFLRRRGLDASRINSDLTQKERDRVLDKLRKGELKYLIATDVAARGIDIKELELVVNYSLHDEPEVYVHRTGRTGRAGATGLAISLIGPQDFGAFHALKRFLPVDIAEFATTETAAEAKQVA